MTYFEYGYEKKTSDVRDEFLTVQVYIPFC